MVDNELSVGAYSVEGQTYFNIVFIQSTCHIVCYLPAASNALFKCICTKDVSSHIISLQTHFTAYKKHYKRGNITDLQWNVWFLLWWLSLFYRYTEVFYCVLLILHWCDILRMYLFIPDWVRKWHNKTVQSVTFDGPMFHLYPLRCWCYVGLIDEVNGISRIQSTTPRWH